MDTRGRTCRRLLLGAADVLRTVADTEAKCRGEPRVLGSSGAGPWVRVCPWQGLGDWLAGGAPQELREPLHTEIGVVAPGPGTRRFLRWDALHTQRWARLFGGSRLSPPRCAVVPGVPPSPVAVRRHGPRSRCARCRASRSAPRASEPRGPVASGAGPGRSQGVALSPGRRGAGPCPGSLQGRATARLPPFICSSKPKRWDGGKSEHSGLQSDEGLCSRRPRQATAAPRVPAPGPASPAGALCGTACVSGGLRPQSNVTAGLRQLTD